MLFLSVSSEREINHESNNWYNTLFNRFLIGEADYCTSPSVDRSTFSKSSIARGNCIFLDFFDIQRCFMNVKSRHHTYHVPYVLKSKEHVLYHARGLHQYDGPWLDPLIPSTNIEEAWANIKKEPMMEPELEQCVVKENFQNFIENYWKSGSTGDVLLT